MRTFDAQLTQAAVSQYAQAIENFEPARWLMYKDNVALTNDNKDIALFERSETSPLTVYGHYFFWSRGKEAIKAAEGFLEEIFTTSDYNVLSIIGLTPTTNKAALWMNRRLGFKEVATMDTPEGTVKMVVLTKQDWENK